MELRLPQAILPEDIDVFVCIMTQIRIFKNNIVNRITDLSWILAVLPFMVISPLNNRLLLQHILTTQETIVSVLDGLLLTMEQWVVH